MTEILAAVTPQHIIALGISVLGSIFGWLLLRAIHGVDSKFEEHGRKLDNITTTMDAKFSVLVTRDGEHDVRLVAHEVRIAHLEAELIHLRGRYESIGGFLQALGYKIRDENPKEQP
jgi:hypothetical protein